ncbi:trigger factor [Thiohalomonas denitrificans]|uniref:Trigger factor n=1 Tax=Thiohalomonas denitrificans TaxID=415747 RepID=A0A1G5QQ37_9GAMM|nr:trigger factor [Thiohalomonas denitrificans]SCZ63640.1 trigger factor [Thiohalomonas denitrificans]
MQVSVEATGGLERRMTVDIPEEQISREVDKRLQQMARTTRIKGFRPGKVPMKVIKTRYGDQVRQEVLGEVVQSSFYEAVGQENLRPAGHPRVEPKEGDENQEGFAYTATFEVMPEIEPAPVEGVEVDKVTSEVTDADVEKMLETLRKQNADWVKVDREAGDGDRVVIDFKGTIDGEPFEGGEGENVPVTIDSGRMIPGFEEGLKGAKAGEERTLDLTFPDDYGYKEVAGKPAQFQVKIHAVEQPNLPEIDDEFAKRFGVESAEALKKEVRDNMERELEQTLKARVKQQVMDKLVELNDVEIPKALIENESQALLEQMRQNMQVPQGKQGPDLSPSMFEEQAAKRVTLGLILAEIIKRNELKAEPEQVRAAVEKIAASYEKPEEVRSWYFGDQRRLGEVESAVLEDRVVDWFLEQAKVTEESKGFDELMNPQQQ